MTITHVQFLTLPVADHARARDFYVGKLGFEALVDGHTLGLLEPSDFGNLPR